MDTLTSRQRSARMALVKGRDTRPELAVRRAYWALGARYRLQVKDLPGRPDMIIRKLRLAVFIHGCFWHRHRGCSRTRTPRSRVAFWTKKFTNNVTRDRRARRQLRRAGWRVVTIWECQSERPERLARFVRASLEVA